MSYRRFYPEGFCLITEESDLKIGIFNSYITGGRGGIDLTSWTMVWRRFSYEPPLMELVILELQNETS